MFIYIFGFIFFRLDISCDNQCHGCDVIVKLDLLPHHLKECEHNPKRPVTCTQGCGQTVAKDEMKVKDKFDKNPIIQMLKINLTESSLCDKYGLTNSGIKYFVSFALFFSVSLLRKCTIFLKNQQNSESDFLS